MKASEMLAARKAAKKEQAVKKYARDNIGNQRADRNKLANIAVIQVQNKLSLRSGAPQDLDSKLTENIKNLMHYRQEDKRKRKRFARRSIKRRLALLPRGRV